MVPGGVWLQTPGPTQKRNGSSVSVSRLMTFDLLNDTGRPPEGRMPHALEGRSGGGVLGATGEQGSGSGGVEVTHSNIHLLFCITSVLPLESLERSSQNVRNFKNYRVF